MNDINFREIEEKWQKKWKENRTFDAEPDEREKFFITIPYPYLNGNLHAGHTRTLTIGDTFARYKRMLGYNVLLPLGFHVTGTPIIGLAELIAKGDERTFNVYTNYHDISQEALSELTTPEKVVELFSREALTALKEIGYSIDWRRTFTTTDDEYKKFIEWQFYKLKEKDLVVKGSHPVRYCPHDRNPVEDHDLLSGEEATIVDYTAIKFKDDEGTVFPCATLRPETIFGVTNLWLKPIKYVIAEVNGEKWFVSKEAYEKLLYTDKEIEFMGEVDAQDYLGEYVENPLTDDRVPILPAEFVDTDSATGVVMSVPAHAPFDFMAIEDLKKENTLQKYGVGELEPIVLIDVEVDEERAQQYNSPAEEIIRKMGIQDQQDESLEKATKVLYKKEFHKGELMDVTGEYAGSYVHKVKDRLQNDLINRGIAEIFYEFSEKPVVCRCGTKCVVRVVKDQWFLNYSNPEWKEEVLNWLEEMRIIPEYYKEEFRNKIAWLKDKACARRKGLGTKIPWDKEWLIESLSDSTIYMAYYILAKYITEGRLKAENMTKELLDYVFLGEGDIGDAVSSSGLDADFVQQVKDDFFYWYPVDLRSSGKDLVANHLLFFLFHHLAIFPPEHYPQAIAVNGFVSLEGQKMSKSKGPLLTMKRAVRENGADVTRMYILYASEYDSDADWRAQEVETLASHLRRLYWYARNYYSADRTSNLDRWLVSKFYRNVKETREAMDNLQTRRAVNTAFFEVMSDVKWYLRRGGQNLGFILDDWLKLIAPFAPHISEEIWSWKHDSFISLEEYPVFNEFMVDEEAEKIEEYVYNLTEDMREVLKFVDAKELHVSPAEDWKRKVLKVIVDSSDLGEAMKRIMSDGNLKENAKEVSAFAKKMFAQKEVKEFVDLDEGRVIERSKEFLEGELGVKILVDSEKVPQEKIKAAAPGKPAIYAV